ncbi:MAG: YIP1 family protein [bacterium]|nr:YIP1 family protein [bacterium]
MRKFTTSLLLPALFIVALVSSCATSNFSRSKSKGIRKVRVEEHVSAPETQKERTYTVKTEKKASKAIHTTSSNEERRTNEAEVITEEISTQKISEPTRTLGNQDLSDGIDDLHDDPEKLQEEEAKNTEKRVMPSEELAEKPGFWFWFFFAMYYAATLFIGIIAFILLSELWPALVIVGILLVPALILMFVLKNKPRRTRVIGVLSFLALIVGGIIAVSVIG